MASVWVFKFNRISLCDNMIRFAELDEMGGLCGNLTTEGTEFGR